MNNNIDIQMIYKGFIKPSIPTPDYLRHYHFSYLDQIAYSTFMPMVLFYKPNLTKQQLCNRLKKSLSEVLTHYYPLAGRVKDKLSVDCNDEGGYYFEADVKHKLSDVFEKLSSNEVLEKFLPPVAFSDSNGVPLAVQLTFFQCGAMAMSFKLSHEVLDGLSFFMFVNDWTAIARGDTQFRPPVLGAAEFFPPKDLSSLPSNPPIVKKKVTDRFYFDAAKVAELVNKYSDNTATGVRHPSRFEALSTFIWNRFMVSTQPEKLGGDRIYTVRTGVNIRPKMQPPLTENYFGNISVVAVSPVPSLEANHGNYNIVSLLRNAVRQINTEFVKKLRNGQTVDTLQQMNNGGKEIIPFVFTKLSRFPLHELDFGWGRIVYGGSAAYVIENNVCFIETETRDGIEALVSLNEDEMAKFVADEEMKPIRSVAKRSAKRGTSARL